MVEILKPIAEIYGLPGVILVLWLLDHRSLMNSLFSREDRLLTTLENNTKTLASLKTLIKERLRRNDD